MKGDVQVWICNSEVAEHEVDVTLLCTVQPSISAITETQNVTYHYFVTNVISLLDQKR